MRKFSVCTLAFLMSSLVIGQVVNGNDEQKPPLYTSYGLSPGGFGIYDKQFLGAGGYFAMPTIAPFYMMQAASDFGRELMLDDKLKRIEGWVEFLTDKELNLRNNCNTLIEQFDQTKGFAKKLSYHPWGFCIANGNNLPDGVDNLFILSLSEENTVVW